MAPTASTAILSASMPTPTKPVPTPAPWMPTTPTSHTSSAQWSTRPTIDEYSQISSEYSKVKDEKKDKCRIVVLTISIENTTEEVADYTPSFIFVSEELNAFNGAIPIGSGSRHCTLLPHETKEMKLRAYIGASQLDQNNLDKLDSSTITLVYSFYPYRRKLVFSR